MMIIIILIIRVLIIIIMIITIAGMHMTQVRSNRKNYWFRVLL